MPPAGQVADTEDGSNHGAPVHVSTVGGLGARRDLWTGWGRVEAKDSGRGSEGRHGRERKLFEGLKPATEAQSPQLSLRGQVVKPAYEAWR